MRKTEQVKTDATQQSTETTGADDIAKAEQAAQAKSKPELLASSKVPDNADTGPATLADGGGSGGGGSDGVAATAEEPDGIKKPGKLSLDRFKTGGTKAASVAVLLPPLPVHRHCDANDHVRLHQDKVLYWSDELCFVNVPTKGQKTDTNHLIDVALASLRPQGQVKRHALALASKPNDVFFLCVVPTQNLDNPWNSTNLKACEQSQTEWCQSASMRVEGVDGYKITPAVDQDAFPEPKWPTQTLEELIIQAFEGRMIDDAKHPAWRRIIGARQEP
jgi:hypothetical protein